MIADDSAHAPDASRKQRWQRRLARAARVARILRARLGSAELKYTQSIETAAGRSRREILDRLVAPMRSPGALPPGWRVGDLDPSLPGFTLESDHTPSLTIQLQKPSLMQVYARSASFGLMYRGKAGADTTAVLEAMVRGIRAGEKALADRPGFARELLEARASEIVVYPQDARIELRPTLACDHHCGFCNSVDRTTRNVTRGAEEILATLSTWEQLPLLFATISGGEPTLLKNLDTLVRELADRGLIVELQTNGMAFDDRAVAERLARAGLSRALISLHAADAESSDAKITRHPGAFARTTRGIDNALASGIEVHLSHVIHRANAGRTTEFLRMVARRWGRRVHVRMAFVAPAGSDAMDLAEHVPNLAEVLPDLRDALAFATVNHLRLSLLDYCGLPPCLVAPYVSFADVCYRGPSQFADDHRKLEACRGCAYEASCPGLWSDYHRLHGDPGLRALPAPTHMNRALRWALLR